MELHKAIKDIVVSKGPDMINNIQIINYLLDYQAFKEKPATRYVLRDLIKEGYVDKILKLRNNNGDWQLKLNKYRQEFLYRFGYDEKLTKFVLESIMSSLDFPITKSEETTSSTIQKTSPCEPISTESKRKFDHVLFDTKRAIKRLSNYDYIDENDLVKIGCARTSDVLEQLKEMGVIDKWTTTVVDKEWVRIMYHGKVPKKLDSICYKNKYAVVRRSKKEKEQLMSTFYS